MQISRRARLVAAAGIAALAAALPASRGGATPPIWEPSFGPALSISNADDVTTSDTGNGQTPVPLGTFAFPYYGTTYTGATELAVDTNGTVSLGAQINSDNKPSGADLVAAAPPKIAPFFADLLGTNLPPDQGDVFLNTFNDDGDPAVDRVVVTWAENEFGACTLAFPACGDRVQLQLKEDGTIIFGYDLVFARPDGVEYPVLVGIARGGQDANTDPGSLSWSQRSQPSTVGDAGYELFASNPRAFDLTGRNLVFTPVSGGYTASINGPDLAVALSVPPTGTTGQPLTTVATVTNHGSGASSGDTLHLSFPRAAIGTATASQGSCTPSGTRVSCALGGLAQGASATVSVSLTPGTAGTLRSTAGLSPADSGDPATDNQAGADTAVGAAGEPSAPAGTGPALTIKAASGQKLSKLAKSGLRVAVRCSTACDLQAIASLTAKQAKAIKLKAARTLGATSASRGGAGTSTLTIKLPATVLKKLRRAKSLSLQVTVNASSVDGESTKTSTLKVKR